ncbi:GmrSD restriction endonuclease domain-containing protein [Neobacillus ginsengisoli]|uniref:GmrSD restriction endonucleases N-terminal domain-containing protein n=1 Tax=Neobacillus ginsengisoli TaxID=904295 RepID=A0ABT9XNI8_9BACI|nr:DUF262 domain-containing protein [Neobacillus ginsengisoli]MDQ0197094.1 hypothetical protein [Neobacillus ginsengisoli]
MKIEEEYKIKEDSTEKDLEETPIEDVEEETVPVNYSISSYGADYPIDSLIKRITRGVIFVPNFQRGYVWKPEHASRFIESLLLGLPVPGIFLAKESETEKLLVIDGQQRLWSLLYFYEGRFPGGRKFALKGVNTEFEGHTYESLPESFRTHLDDCIIHATVIKQEEPNDDNTSIYHIFERLNTGGVRLQPQEIRACIYHGPLNEILHELNNNDSWRKLFGPINKNMKDQELILRFFALNFLGHEYKNPLKEFLNIYMSKNKNFTLHKPEILFLTFERTVDEILNYIGPSAFKPNRALRTAVFDAVMVGISKRLEKGEIKNKEEIKLKYAELLEDEEFQIATRSYTTQEAAVKKRLDLAIKFFGEIE